MMRQRVAWALLVVGGLAGVAQGQALGAGRTVPNLESTIDTPLRYRPDGGDFVIENGVEFFNRPLYGGNTGFRVDAGDKPEFSMYLPGRGGNLRLGVRAGRDWRGAKWLSAAERVEARYRPGGMVYAIKDPLLGANGVLHLEAYALAATEGLIVRAEAHGIPEGVELLWAYGGVNGQRGTRDGDIGTERVPISQYFQLTPAFCAGNTFEPAPGGFTLKSTPATIAGRMPGEARPGIADARMWDSPAALFASISETPAAAPVIVGQVPLAAREARFLCLQRLTGPTGARGAGGGIAEELPTYQAVTATRPAEAPPISRLMAAFSAADLPRVFEDTQAHFRRLRERVKVETPDPFINAAVGALNVSADAIWDEPQGAVMHGAVAWRSRLLGWRGAYAMDALGWHERARRHMEYWATRQNTRPIPATLPPPDEDANLARSEAALHSNGDMSNSHYDMNLVHIDAVFRHLLWTGDVEFARKEWPVIERHLAWERRLFRREYAVRGGEKLPLYEAYAAIWASDDLQYHGGGTTHASAYNYYHNTMAARVAKLIGVDGAPYEKEAGLILRGMRELLWVEERGTFAEFKDLLGLQKVHPEAALWSVYHTIDSEAATPLEAWQMTRYVDGMPHIPVKGAGVPGGSGGGREGFALLPTSTWMPYTWSINNVCMNENAHMALAYFQARRAEEGARLLKSGVLASMYMGIAPGNVGTMTYLDVYRRESQRDFGDGNGTLSRAVVEGLFGIKPDGLAKVLRIEPGFPREWMQARFEHPDVMYTYRREGRWETFTIEPRFRQEMGLRLEWPARNQELARVTVNGREARYGAVEGAVGWPRIWLEAPAAPGWEVVVEWGGEAIREMPEGTAEARQGSFRWMVPAPAARAGAGGGAGEDWTKPSEERYEVVDLTQAFNAAVTEIFKQEYRSPRSPYVSLAIPKQGIGAWAGHVNATATIDDTGLRAAAAKNGGRFLMPNGLPFATPSAPGARNVVFASQWDNYPKEATIPLSGRAQRVALLMAGSTNHMQSRFDNGEVVVTYADGSTARLALHNPTTWWPIEQDYFVDDYQFRLESPVVPPRVNLRTGEVRLMTAETVKGKGGTVAGGAATVLALPLDGSKELRSLTVRALANEVVIGLMSATLVR